MSRRLTRAARQDRGAVAVEFALLLPMLLLLVFGLIDFGRAIDAQITLTQAAREGARLEALGQTTANVQSRTVAAATGLSLTAANVTVVTACPAGAGIGVNAVVTVTYTYSFVTPISAVAGLFGKPGFGSSLSLSATGVMPCET